ncbi:hypothetical protein [Bacillus stratosphericus]|uniref:hypothetical protein n=1 Tax=Bacillus stratosphericus TaxID=293386 RepID=UPI001CFB1C6F|nr:hypothetical protein [Bacillus stratosphericus]
MYFIVFKKGLESDNDNRLTLERPLTFSIANDMFRSETERLLQLGLEIKQAYKILEVETGEIVFNGKVKVTNENQSLLELVTSNSSLPKAVNEYIKKVETSELIETQDDLTYISNSEEKETLLKVKKDKQKIEEDMRKQEEESQKRQHALQLEMDRILAEKEELERARLSREKESEEQAEKRRESLKRLDDDYQIALKGIEDQREYEKENKEKYEAELKEIIAAKAVAEEELKNVIAEYEMKQIEQANELKAIQENTKETKMEIDVVKAKMDKDNLQHEIRLSELQQPQELEAQPMSEPEKVKENVSKDLRSASVDQKEDQGNRLDRIIKPLKTFTKSKKEERGNKEQTIAISDSFHEDNVTNEMKDHLAKILEEVGADEKKKAEEQRKAEIRRVKKEKRIKEAIKMSRLRRPFYERIRYLFTGFLLCAAVLFFLINGFEKPFNSAKQIYHDIHTKVESSWAAFQNDK